MHDFERVGNPNFRAKLLGWTLQLPCLLYRLVRTALQLNLIRLNFEYLNGGLRKNNSVKVLLLFNYPLKNEKKLFGNFKLTLSKLGNLRLFSMHALSRR